MDINHCVFALCHICYGGIHNYHDMSTKYDKKVRALALKMVDAKKRGEHAKYGEFIVQTNEVQLALFIVVLTRASIVDKNYIESLERAELGVLVSLFQTCARKTPRMLALVQALNLYNKYRRRLAHKMFSKQKLTPDECDIAITVGKGILKELDRIGEIRYKPKAKSAQTSP